MRGVKKKVTSSRAVQKEGRKISIEGKKSNKKRDKL